MAFNMTQFNTYLSATDTTFKSFSRIKNSTVDPLIAIIPTGATANPQQKDAMRLKLAYIPYDKQVKYKQALDYLVKEMALTEVKQVPYAIPSSPTMKLEKFETQMRTWPGGPLLDPGTYIHVFKFSFKSSNGNLTSLTTVGTREHVSYTSSPSAAPFNYMQANTPMVFTQGATSNNGAQTGWSVDDHMTILPSMICASPRVNGELVAEQHYEYSSDGQTWHPIPEAYYLLKKGVRGGNVFYFAKTNWAPHNKKVSHFEVEYPLGPQPTQMPVAGVVLGKGGKTPADISVYGRVIKNV